MNRTFSCIVCPNGCEINVTCDNGKITHCEGNQCAKGREYVQQELTDPRRTIATSVLVTGGERPLISVRLTNPIPRAMIFPLMDKIRTIQLTAPVEAGTVVLENVFETGSDLVTTSNVAAQK